MAMAIIVGGIAVLVMLVYAIGEACECLSGLFASSNTFEDQQASHPYGPADAPDAGGPAASRRGAAPSQDWQLGVRGLADRRLPPCIQHS